MHSAVIRSNTVFREKTEAKIWPSFQKVSYQTQTGLGNWFTWTFKSYFLRFFLTLILLNKLRWHAHFRFSANENTCSKLFIQIQILNNKQCRSRPVGFFRSQLIWICTACKGRVYPGSAGQGLKCRMMSAIVLNSAWWVTLILPVTTIVVCFVICLWF